MKKVLTALLTATVLVSAISLSAANRVVVVPLGKRCPEPVEQSFTNSVEMTFNLIHADTFIMGSRMDDPFIFPDATQHEVTLTRPFYIQTTEVTQKQWEDVMHSNPSASNKGDDYPVDSVNWFEAAYYANALTTLDMPWRIKCYDLSDCSGVFGSTYLCNSVGINHDCNGYRLPTEAEWEYAARATTPTAWAYLHRYDNSAVPGQVIGDAFNSNLHAMGWYTFNNELKDGSSATLGPAYPSETKPVAKKQPNKWGLFDMHGNVYEWCQDWYASDYYNDPASGIDPQGPGPSGYKVHRGGSWLHGATNALSACRNFYEPFDRDSYGGFRLVMLVE